MNVSVIICAHNPRQDYLRRVLDALNAQTLAKEHWELLLIDNASNDRLVDIWDLSWHPHARHIFEEKLGLTPARLRGTREATGNLLIFADDDTVLSRNYLEAASRIAEEWFCLGVWGGNVYPEFEVEPRPGLEKYIGLLALIDLQSKIHFTTELYGPSPKPIGAGMCVRRNLAIQYANEVTGDPLRMSLGRKGESLLSSEDEDLRAVVVKCGFGMGMFPELSLTHLIPAERVEVGYLVRLYEEIQFSQMLVGTLHNQQPFLSPKGIWAGLRFHASQLQRTRVDRLMRKAHRNASERFRNWLRTNACSLNQF